MPKEAHKTQTPKVQRNCCPAAKDTLKRPALNFYIVAGSDSCPLILSVPTTKDTELLPALK
jgi:hypothetical protein